MKIAYLDCYSGISGDMLLGALLDAGFPEKQLKEALKRLGLGRFALRVTSAQRMHLTGRRLTVKATGHDHAHRTFSDIRRMIAGSTLASSVKDFSITVFRKLADAEAKIHRTRPSRVNFHEVGALDSIIDIVGTAAAIDYFSLDRIYASPLPLASGLISCQHGVIPLPAPATLALLNDVPVYGVPLSDELVTPTGAALITSLTGRFGPMPPMKIHGIGYGVGSRELPDRPNMLRVVLGEQEADAHADQVLIIETNIDNMNPEMYDYLMERLFASGALDVSLAPVQMKKNRPGVLLKIICHPDKKGDLSAIVFQESTTAGIRYYQAERIKLPRRVKKVRTPYGSIEVKIVTHPDGSIAAAPEYEQCKLIAAKRRIPLQQVYLEIARHLPPHNPSSHLK